MFGLWTMRSALKEEPSDEADTLDVFVPAAAACILVAEPQMYTW